MIGADSLHAKNKEDNQLRIFSYQNKRRAKTALLVIAAAVIIFLLVVLYRFIYLGRYVRIIDGKVTFDYSQNFKELSKEADKPYQAPEIDIIIDEPTQQTSASADLPLEALNGKYITSQMLLDMDSVSAAYSQLTDLPDTILIDLKSIYGNFYYSSNTIGAVTSSADIDKIDSFIRTLGSRDDTYLIARISSLSDSNYALAHQSYGLPRSDGALWMCDRGCYWLDPMEDDVQDYLVSIAIELSSMGFDEIVFDGFYVPDSKYIKYNRDITREEASIQSAEAIRSKLSDTPIRVSFTSQYPGVYTHSDRIYLATDDGAAVASLVESVSETVTDPSTEVVFLTPSRDTRFDSYGILRPLVEPREE